MNFDEISQEIKRELDGRHAARELALRQSRLLIQICSKSIKHLHRRQLDEAAKLLDEAKDLSRQMREAAVDHPEVLHAGYIQDAEKEMVEAAGVMAMLSGSELPSPQNLGVEAASYLNGMGEAASELRRTVLDELRQGRYDAAQSLLAQMDAVYDELTTFDYPDAVTGGLRRTCDALRAVIERTRSDVTLTLAQGELLAELKKHKGEQS